jgi:GNAT superfamily N-acetyltransferase
MAELSDMRVVSFQSDTSETRRAEIEAIFFAASPTRTFATDAERAVFRDKWLGRYLESFPHLTFVSVDAEDCVTGYVVGAAHNPTDDLRFADIGYFRAFGDLSEAYPAHLHINLAPRARNRQLGGRLIEAFANAARAEGAGGLHVVTSENARNRTFYGRQGFALKATILWLGNPIVFLAKPL